MRAGQFVSVDVRERPPYAVIFKLVPMPAATFASDF
jgi:hypothetical protein